ncbi:MAG: hypothetical protein H7Y19_00050 [Luteimonas sp.]|nr:hypothetical protein [Luteimonas sp.]
MRPIAGKLLLVIGTDSMRSMAHGSALIRQRGEHLVDAMWDSMFGWNRRREGW